ncbi:YiiX family permuted papain-like enzyme [Candidatus Dojkabacteria bacterium]|nr:YiiX family permuted papain-like enzyme [Candidatus Dojkabacteria bacterium]
MIKKLLFLLLIIVVVFGLYHAVKWFYHGYIYAKAIVEDKEQLEVNQLYFTLKEGDIIFQTSLSNQSKAIQLATGSQYSHMGIVFMEGVVFYVLEAVQPVKVTKLTDWIKRGEEEKYVVKRLKGSDSILTKENLLKMKQVGRQYLGLDYDIHFEWSDDKFYCSELVWKIYKKALDIEIGELQKLKDFDLNSSVVKEKLKERFGEKVPLEEPVISPISMYNSQKLETVINK